MSEQMTIIDVDNVPINVGHAAGKAPGLVWLGGYRSDMSGTKAERLCQTAKDTGLTSLRHDYSGHGQSGGEFREGTISRWLDESLAVFSRFGAERNILVGSSMGAWIALRMVQELEKRGESSKICGLLLLAPAPDFTYELMEPELTQEQRDDLINKGFFEEETPYGPEPNVFTRDFFEDGAKNRVLNAPIDTNCPVHIIQGMNDPDVPYTHALRLVEHLPADDVTLTLIKDGDHRLSRESDLETMVRAIENMVALNT